MQRRVTDNAHVAAMLDGVTELPCVFCERPAHVPHDILAVVQSEGAHRPIPVCPSCSDWLIVVLPLFRAGIESAGAA